MGSADRVIRLIIAATIAILFFTEVISGTLEIVLVAFSAIFLLTSLASTCPLYLPFGLSTRRSKKPDSST